MDVEGFAKVWNKNGIIVMLDNTAKEFARDFANIVLKSFILDQINRSMKAQAVAEQAKQKKITLEG